MSGVNKVILIGNVGKAPETNEKMNMAKFSVATSSSWKDKNTGEKVTETQWQNITCFKHTAEYVMNWVGKGAKVYIEGTLKTETYPDPDGGKDRYTTKIIAREVQKLSRDNDDDDSNKEQKSKSTASAAKKHRDVKDGTSTVEDDVDIPF